jgi:hypothetical protein
MYNKSIKILPLHVSYHAGLGADAVTCFNCQSRSKYFYLQLVSLNYFATTVALVVDHLFFNELGIQLYKKPQNKEHSALPLFQLNLLAILIPKQ